MGRGWVMGVSNVVWVKCRGCGEVKKVLEEGWGG